MSLADALKQYISSKYDQHPDMFKQDLEVIDNLRRDAVNVVEPHASGAKRLAAYAAQLAWMGGKFPIDVSPVSRKCGQRINFVFFLDWRRVHLVSCTGLQYRAAILPR